MSNEHSGSAKASIEYGDASPLFPVESLDATVDQYRDAELALADVDEASVVTVAPTSMATGYALGQHALTAIRVESLPAEVRVEIGDAIDDSIKSFDLIQVGNSRRTSPNHSLAEFTDA